MLNIICKVKAYQSQDTEQLSSETSTVSSISVVVSVTIVTSGNFLLKYTVGSVENLKPI